MTFQKDQEIEKLIMARDFERADQMITERLIESPHAPDPHYLRGVWFTFQGKVGPGVKSLRKALDLDPHHTDAAICLSVLLNDVGRYEDAKKVFQQANQSVSGKASSAHGIDVKFAVKHLELADLYFRYRRYDEAIEEYTRAALLDPSALDIRVKRAKAFAKKGLTNRALQELLTLKQERPQHLSIRVQLGLLHMSLGNRLDAELEWEDALKIDPHHPEARAYLRQFSKSGISGPERVSQRSFSD
jgi:tetratricopeptide (TPR) repeat protein